VKLQWQAKPLFAKYRMTTSQIMTPSAKELTETSDRQGMKQFGLLFQLAASGRPTEGIECGLLPQMLTTPNCNDAREVPADLRPSRYETGRTTDYLSRQVAMLPTPKERDWKGQTQKGAHSADGLPNVVIFQDGKRTGMRLQPSFVEFLMGYPDGWTELED
jgi:hypothetical protein